jgi:uncharacterized protein
VNFGKHRRAFRVEELMKIILAVVFALTFGTAGISARPARGSAAQAPSTQKPAAPAAAPGAKIDPAKEADIRRLLDLVGTKAMVTQTVESMSASMKPVLKNSLPAGDYRDKLVDLFFAKFLAKMDVQHLLDLAVPIYDRNFSHEEIRNLIAFYQTPLGQKTVSTLPKLTAELQKEGGKWGEELGRESMTEVLTEHPEFADAIAAAQKAAPKTTE